MKKLYIYFFLVLFSLQTPSLADDIRDFQIEGMSIGDSLLKYYSKEEIKNAHKYKYNNNKFIGAELRVKNFEQYEVIQIHYKPSKEYIISSVIGGIYFEDSNDCYKKKDEVVADLSESFEDFKKIDRGTFQAYEDETGKSTMTAVEFHLKNGEVGVTCTNYSNEFKIKNDYSDNIRVDISTKEFSDWLRNEAYK